MHTHPQGERNVQCQHVKCRIPCVFVYPSTRASTYSLMATICYAVCIRCCMLYALPTHLCGVRRWAHVKSCLPDTRTNRPYADKQERDSGARKVASTSVIGEGFARTIAEYIFLLKHFGLTRCVEGMCCLNVETITKNMALLSMVWFLARSTCSPYIVSSLCQLVIEYFIDL